MATSSPVYRADTQRPSRTEPSPTAMVWWMGGLICVCVLGAYHNSFSVPFFFDDEASIVNNPAIRSLWSWDALFGSPPNAGIAGRPLLALSFALNYALGGLAVGGYHAVNWLVHVAAAMALFGVVRRTLLRPMFEPALRQAALWLAAAVALVWALHPLQTESVTYVSQRAEAMFGLFYLLTLYAVVRAADVERPGKWQLLGVVACAAGMATKEIMVTAPVAVLLYDRTFLAGSFREAWRERKRMYLGLAATWVLLAGLMVSSSLERRGIGYAHGISPLAYGVTECRAVLHYLRLAIWPHPLVLDYGTDFAPRGIGLVVAVLSCVGLGVGTLVALWKKPAVGFVGAWFFIVLAPTSSVVPVAFQPVGEHRMYLPLAALVTAAVVGSWRCLGRHSVLMLGAILIGFGVATERRNRDYQSEETMWRDTLAKVPSNARIQNTLACVLVKTNRAAEAEKHFRAALAIQPDEAEFLRDYAGGLSALDRPAEALVAVERALLTRPADPVALNTRGYALSRLGRAREAIGPITQALALRPNFPEARCNLGFALGEIGEVGEAVRQLELAAQMDPNSFTVLNELGRVLCKAGQVDDAVGRLTRALELKPDFAEARCNLGNASFMRGAVAIAITHYERALSVKPELAEAQCNLGLALAETGRLAEAAERCLEALRLKPNYPEALTNLGIVLLKQEKPAEAVERLRAAIALKPDYAEAHNVCGVALLRVKREAEAVEHFEAALRTRPDYGPARDNLARLRALRGEAPVVK